MYFFDVMQSIELLPGLYIGLSSTTYYQYHSSLVPQEESGWFLVQKTFCLPAGEALAFRTLPSASLRAGLRSWFPVGEDAKGASQGSGIYLAVEPTVLPVGAKVQLTADKALAWQFYLQDLGTDTFEVKKAIGCAPGEWVRCSTRLKSLPQQWIQLCARDFSEISRERLLRMEWMACRIHQVKESVTLPAGWILRLSAYQTGRYVMHTFETLKESWYRNLQPILLSRGDLLGVNQGVVPKGLSAFEAPMGKDESVSVAEAYDLGGLLKEKGAMTLTDLLVFMPHCHRRWLLRQLQRLMDQGQVVRQGQGRATVYQWQPVDKLERVG